MKERKRKKAHTQNFYCDTRDEYRMVNKINKCDAKQASERKKEKEKKSAKRQSKIRNTIHDDPSMLFKICIVCLLSAREKISSWLKKKRSLIYMMTVVYIDRMYFFYGWFLCVNARALALSLMTIIVLAMFAAVRHSDCVCDNKNK